ncbi:PQQ-binding-like beta-propeller repeat protein, partial [Halorussus sp. GCM10023401]
GVPRWTADLPAAPMAAPRVHGGDAFCVAGGSSGFWGTDVRLLRFGSDGSERWRTDPVDQFLNVLAFGGGRAYLATSDDALDVEGQTLSAVGLSDGETAWSVESGDAFEGHYLDETLLVGPGGGQATASHDPATGNRQWSGKVGALSSATESFVVADGALFAETRTDGDSAFAAVELSDGTERWTYAEVPVADRPFVPTGAAVAGDIVVGTGYDGAVFALDVTDGAERWTFDADGQTREPPTVADGTLYVGAYNDGRPDAVHALDAVTGEERWRVSVRGFATFLQVAGESLVVGSHTRSREFVSALDASDGSARWTFETSEQLFRPAVGRDGRVFVASDAGLVRELGN